MKSRQAQAFYGSQDQFKYVLKDGLPMHTATLLAASVRVHLAVIPIAIHMQPRR
uniref:Uncharacterized protein n=1 Tax=Physcomitrium patens TaxID=3218 RepID=A0A2K1JGY6_PHYPA|nr:hypothetical protein PHYPA_018182 [Physcomitrium patens]